MRGMLPHDIVATEVTTIAIARRVFLGGGLAAGVALLLRGPALARTAVTVYKEPT
jgi:hypothetical protein